MTSQDSQTRIATLADSLRNELDETVKQLINCAERFAPPGSGEPLFHLEWFVRFCLETQLAPSLLATASAICQGETAERSGPLAGRRRSIERLRALVARTQTQPLLEMDSEFESYMCAKFSELLPAASASSSSQLNRERLAIRRFDEKVSELDALDS